MRMFRASQRDHGKSMRERREVLFQFVRRLARRNEMYFVEIKAPVRGARQAQMAAVDGIEGTAEKRDAAGMMFCGGSVRLRGRQCASQVVSTILMNPYDQKL